MTKKENVDYILIYNILFSSEKNTLKYLSSLNSIKALLSFIEKPAVKLKSYKLLMTKAKQFMIL